MEMQGNGRGEREGERKEREVEEGGAVIQGLSVNTDSASPRWPETEITANHRAIINAAYTAFSHPAYSSACLSFLL